MYRNSYLPLAALVGCLGITHLSAQVILNPNSINGTVQFTNTNPAILSLLGPPGNLGMTGGGVYANSLPPAQPFQDAADFTTNSATSAHYTVTVESDNPGIAYGVFAIVNLGTNADTYQFAPSNSVPVVSNGPAATVNLSESVTILDLRFVSAALVPKPVTSGRIIASIPSVGQQAFAPQLSAGSTNHLLAVRGGTTQNLDILLNFGTNSVYDGFTLDLVTNVAALNDQVMVIYCIVPDTNVLGRITGNVSLGGEFLERTVMEAAYGPFNNERAYNLPGTNFSVSSSGPFLLTNLLPSDITAPPGGYYVFGTMELRTNFQYNYLITPQLGGANPLVIVPDGGSVDLSNIFDLTPGYLDGQITLLGPTETARTNSILRHVLRFIELDPSSNGIPASAADYGNYDSFLSFAGVARKGTGATLTAYGGFNESSFPGSYVATSNAFEGSYEAVVGGLKSENSVWRLHGLNLTMQNLNTSDENAYAWENLDIQDNRTNEVEVAPGQHYTNDLGYCFSEVSVRFRSSSGRFFQPRLILAGTTPGAFNGTDFQGHAANYQVYLVQAFGTPAGVGGATNTGLVRAVLPQGTYTLYPTVILVDTNGGYEETGLPPISLTVGCQQRILIDQCLQLNVNLPSCVNTNPYVIAGSVAGCTNVVSITYQLDGGATNSVCSSCGLNPSFSFPLNLGAVQNCSNHTLVVTARDAGGEVSSASSQIQYNNSVPVINCPSNMLVMSLATNLAPVMFNVTATANCSGPVMVTCVPPSGSLFPAGTNTVSCYAVDSCGNSNTCSFLVTVIGPQPPWLPVTNTSGYWRCVASSKDGSKLVAAGDTSIMTSTNSGATFAFHGPNAGWTSLASSDDGNRLAAAPYAAADGNGSPAPIYASSDAGTTWTQFNIGYNHWTSIASSSNGVRLAASAALPLTSGPNYIYTSSDSGANWNISGAPVAIWRSVASSGDGTRLAAVSDGLIYTSTDAGTNWTPRSAPNTNWASIASSSDGTRLVAAVGGPYYTVGEIYVSTDSGANWTPTSAPIQTWTSVACSADGSKLVAVVGGLYETGSIYSSPDSGATWVSNNAPVTNWTSVATSADGTEGVAVSAPGAIYVWHVAHPPSLSISLTLTNTVMVSWPSPSTGYNLQVNPVLGTTTWTAPPETINDNGTIKFIIVNPPSGNRFYRLKYP